MTMSYIAHTVFRFLQLVLALAVCGLYGADLNRANKQHKYSDGKWVCASSQSTTTPPVALECHNAHMLTI